MEDFLGMNRNTNRIKTPTGMWEFARNILLKKGWKSISNEYGADEEATIPGNYIGSISTNEETVIFSLDGGFSCIGLTKKENPNVYVPIIRSIYLGFKINRPIEGVFLYNYNKELIIVFSDGVFKDSNPPRLLNLTDLDLDLDVNYELVSPADLNLINLFNSSQEAQIELDYGNEIALDLKVVYITYTYILADGVSTTGFYPVHHLAYPYHKWNKEIQRSIIVNITELDPKYAKIKLGLLVNTGGGLVGYESPIFDFNSSNLSIEITSLSTYTSISPDLLVVSTIFYSRVKTMTLQNNQLVFGNVAIDNQFALQKYINQLELGIELATDNPEYLSHPNLCPDEVYAIYIQPQLKTSEYLEAYPLIGPNPVSASERTLLGDSELTALGLKNATEGLAVDTWRQFHIKNTGGFVLPPPYDELDPAHKELTWGYWENEETYPNNEEFNSTIDYAGDPLSGVDLRSTPIKYFRVPGLDRITEKYNCTIGNTDNIICKANNESVFYGGIPKFAVYIKNFETAIPLHIREQLQGYRLLIVKRKKGDRIVEDITFAHSAQKSEQDVDGSTLTLLLNMFRSPIDNSKPYRDSQYGYCKLFSPTLHKYKSAVTAKLVKANYGIQDIDSVNSSETGIRNRDIDYLSGVGLEEKRNYKIKETQRYAVVQDVEYLPSHNIAANTFLTENTILMTAKNYLAGDTQHPGDTVIPTRWNPLLQTYDGADATSKNQVIIDKYNPNTRLYDTLDLGTLNNANTTYYRNLPYEITLSISLINLIKNIHIGFSPTEFISLGRVSIENPTQRLNSNGDFFSNNALDTFYTSPRGSYILGRVSFTHQTHLGCWGPIGNTLVGALRDRTYGYAFDLDGGDSRTGDLVGLNYEQTILFENSAFSSLNDLISASSFSVNNKSIGYFPFRVARTPKIPNENIQTDVIRTFKANDYYEMLNNRGEVIAVRGTNKQLFIQQKYSLFVATLKDKLQTGETETYLGQGDIFDRTPDEIKYNTDKGYIGCTNQIAAVVCPEGYIVKDQIKGNIFLIGQSFLEVSRMSMSNWFQKEADTSKEYYTLDRFDNKQPVDNPYNSIGHLIGYDEEFNRLLFTKKDFRFKFKSDIGTIYSFDGEFYYIISGANRIDFHNEYYFENKSYTLSYSLDENQWVCEHDYYPNAYYFNTFGMYGVYNNSKTNSIDGLPSLYKVYKHNSKLQQRGTFYQNETFDSYIDLIFNNRLDLIKHYQAVTWESVVKGIDGSTKYNKTIDKIALYNDYQCTGEIPLSLFENVRNVEGIWKFNEFRDIVVDNYLPVVNDRGRILDTNLNNNKSYFEKSLFIGTFVVVRLIMSNSNTDDVYLNFVHVKSRVSNR